MLDQVFFWNFIAQFLNVKVQKLGDFNSFNWEQALVGSFSAMLKFSRKFVLPALVQIADAKVTSSAPNIRESISVSSDLARRDVLLPAAAQILPIKYLCAQKIFICHLHWLVRNRKCGNTLWRQICK